MKYMRSSPQIPLSYYIKSYDIIPEEHVEPYNYSEASQDKDVELWQKAMNLEMESMYSN